MSSCIFCRIASHQQNANILKEDDDIMVFHDIDPVAPVHLLIIPKRHIESVRDLSEKDRQLAGKMFLMAQQAAIETGLDRSGYRLVVNTGREGGQAVFHWHMHLLGGRSMRWPPG